jgi:hypothetical protein
MPDQNNATHSQQQEAPPTSKHNVYKNKTKRTVTIFAELYFYGGKSTPELAKQMAEDLQYHWNKPAATISIDRIKYRVLVSARGHHVSKSKAWILSLGNKDYKNFFIRVEEFVDTPEGNVSQMSSGAKSNTGFFKYENIRNRLSSTEAHEIGCHGWGSGHPPKKDLTIRGIKFNAISALGKGQPGINYPQNSIVDSPFQINPKAKPGTKHGGTLDPNKRFVTQQDVELLRLELLPYDNMGRACLGGVTNEFYY